MLVLLAVLVFVPSVVCNDNQWFALRFGGTSSDYIGPFHYDMTPFRDSLSICMWVKLVDTSAPYPIVFDYEPGNEIHIGSNGLYNQIGRESSLNGLESKFTSPVGTWFHYCITFSRSSGIRLYLDGDLIGTARGPGRSLKMGGTLCFSGLSYGRYSHSSYDNYLFGGELYQFNMFSDVLSDTSVKKIAQGGLCFGLKEFSATRILRWEDLLERTRNGNVRKVKVCDAKEELAARLDKSREILTTLSESQELVANAVGRLDETDVQLETVIRQFNSTADGLRDTKDELTSAKEHFQSVAKELNSAKEDLGVMVKVFNSTKEGLDAMVKEFNSTKEDIGAIANEFNCVKDLGALEKELNSTKEALRAMEKDLNSAKKDLGAMATELNSTKEDLGTVRTKLEEETARHNKTEELLESSSATLTDLRNQLKNSRTFQNISRWDVLYTRPYFNNQFTDELYEKLTTSWEMLRQFVGVNMTEGIIEHFRQYHNSPECESMEKFSYSMFVQFREVQRTEGIVAHLMDHMFPPNSDCNDDVKDN